MAQPFRAVVASTWIVSAALALAAQGCRYPQAIHTYEYVTDYERMSPAYDATARVSLVYVPQATSFKDNRGIIIGDVTVGEVWVDSPEQAKRYAAFFRSVLRIELLKLKKFDFVSLDKPEAGSNGVPPGTLLLEGEITKFNMGSGFLRYLDYFLWFLQAGATDLQVEGRITDTATGELRMEFVDRRRHLCNTPFGPNPRNLHEGYGMRVTAAETALCLAKLVEMGWDGLPATPSSSSPPGAGLAADVTGAAHEERQ